MNARMGKVTTVSGVLLLALAHGVDAHPNHLEPIPPYDPDGYDQAVFASLIGTRTPALWMIEKHSFANEYAVIVRQEITYDPNHFRREQWIVEHVVAREKIWRLKPVGNGRVVLDIKPTDDVERRCATVTLDFAWTVQRAWQSVLKLTRYSGDYKGIDGTTLQFYCEHKYFGEIWSPDTGLPAMLADLGHKLRAIARSDETNKGVLVTEAANLARRITKEAEAEHKRLFARAAGSP